jgi:RNA recognition motif-containing protein
MIYQRYAAKEAAKKAYRHRDLTWHDIWIQSGQSVNGRSKAPQALIISENGSWEDGEIVPMNISHDSDYATAVCLSHEPGSYVVAGDTSPNAESGNNSRIDTSETVDTEKSQSVWAQERDKTLRMQELSERLRSVKPYGIYDPRARAMEDWLKGKIIWNGAPRQAAMELDAAMKKQKREEEERKAPRQVAMDLEVTKKKKRREDEIFRKLMYSEDRMEQNEEDPRFIRRIYTIPNPQQAERAKRTIFVGNIHPETTIDDLQATFAQYSASVKAYLYANTEGELLGTGAIVLETGDEAATACQEKDQSDLHGNVIRCLPWFSRAFRRFLQRGVGTDAVFLRQRQDVEDRERALLETETETLQDTVPKPLLESEPLPQPSSPQYILVRELFRIQDEYHNRRSRGIFVTGLNTDATEDDLRQHFAKISENATVTLRRRKDGRSLGTAYVTFETPEEATEAREKMDGTLLLGGVISCQVGSGKEDLGKWTKAIARDLDKF